MTGLALANWLADAAVLAVSIRATGAAVPWHDLLLVYGVGIAAQSLNITPGGLGVTEGSLSLALAATGLCASHALAAVLLYRLASFWLVALAGWLVVFWLRRPRTRRGPGPSRNRAAPRPRMPAGLGARELVLLHGQPGSPADWQQVAGRLPAQLHAIAPDRPGYGSSQLPAGGFAANARAILDDLDARGITRAVLVGHSYGGGVALSAVRLAPGRVAALVLLASVGPGCVTGWDRLLAAPGTVTTCNPDVHDLAGSAALAASLASNLTSPLPEHGQHFLDLRRVTIVWVTDWWDGPVESMASYQGRDCGVQAIFDTVADKWTSPWRCRLYELSTDERQRLRARHRLWEQYAGGSSCYHPDAPDPAMKPGWQAFYQHADRKPAQIGEFAAPLMQMADAAPGPWSRPAQAGHEDEP